MKLLLSYSILICTSNEITIYDAYFVEKHFLYCIHKISSSISFSAVHTKYFNVWQKCNFSTQRVLPPHLNVQKKNITPFPPLTKAIPNLPRAIYSIVKEEHQTTQTTILPNGLTVASEDRFGPFCTIGGKLHKEGYK